MVDAMVLYGGLIQKIIAWKLITFGANGVSVFQGDKTGGLVERLECSIHD
jgi:hypothetical protein